MPINTSFQVPGLFAAPEMSKENPLENFVSGYAGGKKVARDNAAKSSQASSDYYSGQSTDSQWLKAQDSKPNWLENVSAGVAMGRQMQDPLRMQQIENQIGLQNLQSQNLLLRGQREQQLIQLQNQGFQQAAAWQSETGGDIEKQARTPLPSNPIAQKQLMPIHLEAIKSTDATLFGSAISGMNDAGKTGGADAVLAYKPPTFLTPQTYKAFTDTQMKLAKELRSTAEAKAYEQLTEVEKGRIADIKSNDVMSNEGRAAAIDEVFEAASKRQAALKNPFSVTSASPGSVIYDKQTGEIISTVPTAASVANEYQTETYKVPPDVTPAVKEVKKTHLFGKDEIIVPGSPAVTNSPAKTITRKVKIDQPKTETKTQFDSVEQAQKAGRKAGDTVLMWNPAKNKYQDFILE